MRSKVWQYGGIAAAIILIAFGIVSIAVGANGRDTVRSNLGSELIVGTPDMTPSAIKAAAQKAGLKDVAIPTKSVAGQTIDTGSEARAFAQYMRIHSLEATGGKTYAEMPRFATADGKGTNDEKAALKNPKTGAPVDNPARQIWVTETALTTALNTSYFAENVAMFSIVMGIALLLTGVGFGVMSLGLLPSKRRSETTTTSTSKAAVAAS
jgi:hypothetical protein